MYNVRQVLQGKGHSIWSVAPDASVLEAVRLLAEKNVGALLVVEDEKLVGIISERDIVRLIAHLGEFKVGDTVKEYMTQVLYTVKPEDTMETCMQTMTQRHIRHLPVMDGSQLVGVISIGDVVKEVIELREETIHNLENYIMGDGYGR